MFEDATAFSQYIERRSVREKTPCTQLVLDFCERKSLDVDDVTHLFTRQLKEKMKNEMIDQGLYRKTDNTFDI